jgi:hypothetical protein
MVEPVMGCVNGDAADAPVFFHTVAAANKAGKAALKQLLAKLNT